MSAEKSFLWFTASQWITIVGVIVLIIGWFVNSLLTSNRDLRNRQDTARIAYLVDAYDKLTLAANRPQMTTEFARMIEEALARIQLYGNPNEITLVHSFLAEWDATGRQGQPRGSLDPLIFALRNALRREMGQPAVDSQVKWIRPLGGAQ